MTERRRWGKAGQRLTPEQARQRDGLARFNADRAATVRSEDDRIAHAKWAAGLVIPNKITMALGDLSGPEVDWQCGVTEPAVDLWEAGKLYPSWEQLLKLAALTGKRPRWFTEANGPLSFFETSMRFHFPRFESVPLPRIRYPDDVVARCPGTGVSA